MNRLRNSFRNTRYLMRWGIVVSSLLAIFFMCLSFLDLGRFQNYMGEIIRMEKRLHHRQDKLEAVALAALEMPKSEWIKDSKLDEDQVVYKYYYDSLCSWVNTLPIAHDDIFALGHVPLDFVAYSSYSGEAASQYPLLYVGERERYMNLGSAWYIVKAYYKAPYTVVAALLVQTDYPFSNSFIKSSVNPRLRLGQHLSIIPVGTDEGNPVFSRGGGTVLFNVLNDVQMYKEHSSMLFRWLAMFCAVFAVFFFLWGFPKGINLWIVLPLFAVLRLFCYFLEKQMTGMPIFSPNLYADTYFSGSLGNFLLNNLFIFFVVSAIVILRRSFTRFFYALREAPRYTPRHIFWMIRFASLPILLAIYIHIAFRSIINNSSVVMEIFKVNELSIYSILIYASFALLFIALYFLICLGWPVWVKNGSRATLLSQRALIIYVVFIALYSLLTVAVYGSHKETERNRVWTQKAGIERDPDTELMLRTLDSGIAVDMMLSAMLQADQPTEAIMNLLMERFFSPLRNLYDIQITICKPGDNLLVDMAPPAVNCYNYFHKAIADYGIQLYDDSHFFYLNNVNGRTSYIGVYSFRFFGGYRDLYIELDSRSVKDAIGYPELLRDHVSLNSFQIPENYSFAKYLNGHLTAFSGSYIYPTRFVSDDPVGSFVVMKTRGYLHYVNKFDDQTIILLSHPVRTFFTYIVSFSYLIIFYGVLVFAITRTPVNALFLRNPKRSFRRKIMLLLVISLIIALVAMAIGSIWFGIRMYTDNSNKEMDEKLQTAQSTLEYYLRYVNSLEGLRGMDAELNQLSKNIHMDINIYTPQGLLMHTSQWAIFEKHLMGTRMNDVAFEVMDRMKRLKFFHQEHIGDLQYYSVYAPLFNIKGALIAYLNLPYFSRQTDITSDISSIVATVVNIYILLLVAALLAGAAISNQVARPLVEVGKKMKRLDLTKQLEHIDYKGEDELGELIHAYNDMVDDVAAASQRMAQTEREQAWREMARQIAHEIKNPLTPMRLSLQHLMRLKKENVPDWPARFDGLAKTLIEQIDILSDAASELSSFSRFYSEEAAPVELNQLIREQCNLFNTGEAIRMYFISAVDNAVVMGRKRQLSRVLVNLVSNARQALEGQAQGQIRVRLEKWGTFYALHIEDDGPGVPEELRIRLFTPNFTTKSGGTGLGLAICRSIIEQGQGTISYDTSEWGGACFTIVLPVWNEPEDPATSVV